MTEIWELAPLVAGFAGVVARGLFELRRGRRRRENIERLVLDAPAGTRIVDRDSDGATIDIVIGSGRDVRRGD